MNAGPVIIKKYENRRLYDTCNSRYVNLEDIAQMVRHGTEVQVIDAASGEDLTRLVLAQIIVENAKASDSAFPLDMLRQIIIASGRVGREGLLGYMKVMSDMYQNAYRTFAPGFSPFDFMQKRDKTAAGSAAPPQSSEPSVDELRRRIEDLERMVRKSSVAHPAAKSKRSSRHSRP